MAVFSTQAMQYVIRLEWEKTRGKLFIGFFCDFHDIFLVTLTAYLF